MSLPEMFSCILTWFSSKRKRLSLCRRLILYHLCPVCTHRALTPSLCSSARPCIWPAWPTSRQPSPCCSPSTASWRSITRVTRPWTTASNTSWFTPHAPCSPTRRPGKARSRMASRNLWKRFSRNIFIAHKLCFKAARILSQRFKLQAQSLRL